MGPYARAQGWAPGPISDWETGAAGWVLWVSLAIMLGDSVTSLTLLSVSSIAQKLRHRGCAPLIDKAFKSGTQAGSGMQKRMTADEYCELGTAIHRSTTLKSVS